MWLLSEAHYFVRECKTWNKVPLQLGFTIKHCLCHMKLMKHVLPTNFLKLLKVDHWVKTHVYKNLIGFKLENKVNLKKWSLLCIWRRILSNKPMLCCVYFSNLQKKPSETSIRVHSRWVHHVHNLQTLNVYNFWFMFTIQWYTNIFFVSFISCQRYMTSHIQ